MAQRGTVLLGLIFVALSLWGCMLPEREEREILFDVPILATYASSEESDAWGLNLLGGLFQCDVHAAGSHTHFFPLLFNTEGPEEDSFFLLLPFYYHRREPFREETFYFLAGKQEIDGRTIYRPLYPLFSFSPTDAAGRRSFFLFPLVDLDVDGDRGRLDIVNVLGLVKVFGHQWGLPPEPGAEPGTDGAGGSRRGSFALLNVLNIFQLAGGRDLGAYEDFYFATLLGSERLSLFQRHWRRDGTDGRTDIFPHYWHFRDEAAECYHFWPFFSTSSGTAESGSAWTRTGVLSDMFSLRKEEGVKTLKLFWFIPI